MQDSFTMLTISATTFMYLVELIIVHAKNLMSMTSSGNRLPHIKTILCITCKLFQVLEYDESKEYYK